MRKFFHCITTSRDSRNSDSGQWRQVSNNGENRIIDLTDDSEARQHLLSASVFPVSPLITEFTNNTVRKLVGHTFDSYPETPSFQKLLNDPDMKKRMEQELTRILRSNNNISDAMSRIVLDVVEKALRTARSPKNLWDACSTISSYTALMNSEQGDELAIVTPTRRSHLSNGRRDEMTRFELPTVEDPELNRQLWNANVTDAAERIANNFSNSAAEKVSSLYAGEPFTVEDGELQKLKETISSVLNQAKIDQATKKEQGWVREAFPDCQLSITNTPERTEEGRIRVEGQWPLIYFSHTDEDTHTPSLHFTDNPE
nr:hypothetical protein L204_04947 [Cryptococcus depauperatus CBS 7855]